MQSKKTSDQQLVKICMADLCTKIGLVSTENLLQRDLRILGEYIHSETGVLISRSTIKRLLNGQFSLIPQIATLDAIAMAAGHQNWQRFKLDNISHNGNVSPNRDNLKEAKRLSSRDLHKFRNGKLVVFGSLLIAVLLGLWVIRKPGIKELGGEKAQFSARKITGNDLPNTVVFSYNIDSVNADSFFIQQSWDTNRRVKIYKHQYTLTDIYYVPGYHTAKLIADNQIIKKIYVSIPTDRWVFYAEDKAPKSRPKYILSTNLVKNGALPLTPNDILKNNIDIQKENTFFQVYFPSKILTSSDDFVLKFRIKVNALNNESCPYFMSEVFCQKYFMYFISTLKGCTSDVDCSFGENEFNGKTNDLSSLGSDVKAWQNVKFIVKNKNVTISINSIKVFSAKYYNSCGLITGLGFISNGLCEVADLDLRTNEGTYIYSNGFEH